MFNAPGRGEVKVWYKIPQKDCLPVVKIPLFIPSEMKLEKRERKTPISSP
jgi:hypothetical protein